ncbi:hypothetical protein AXF42_Ash003605 [Apostasia shenzhenica]|uniref:Uncharacterized protein n=1 Tax=Apostasia shenzhenica TaxID=1088818 RepID=A0A2I0AHC4_9ASPA|nr:hypothetical protein AXF42_Ash003605 [Apostasia shenzhenica]
MVARIRRTNFAAHSAHADEPSIRAPGDGASASTSRRRIESASSSRGTCTFKIHLTDLVTGLTAQQAVILRQTQSVCATILPPAPLPPIAAVHDPLPPVAVAPTPFSPIAALLLPFHLSGRLLLPFHRSQRLLLPSRQSQHLLLNHLVLLNCHDDLFPLKRSTKIIHQYVLYYFLPSFHLLFLPSSPGGTLSSQVFRPPLWA